MTRHSLGGWFGGWFGGRYARRLAAAFAVTALLAATLTTVLVNVAFSDRFDRYVQEQQQQRVSQLVTAAADTHRQAGGWNRPALDALAAPAAITGATLQLRDPTGRTVYNTTQSGQLPAMSMHRQMMRTGPLDPARSPPVVVDGRRVGTAVVAVATGGLPPGEQSFRSSVNRLLLGGGLSAAAIALLVGIVSDRRLTRPLRELTAAAAGLADGQRSRRATVTSPTSSVSWREPSTRWPQRCNDAKTSCGARSSPPSPTSCTPRWPSCTAKSRQRRTACARPPPSCSTRYTTKRSASAGWSPTWRPSPPPTRRRSPSAGSRSTWPLSPPTPSTGWPAASPKPTSPSRHDSHR